MKTIDTLKQNNQDFEWYPTTTEILDTIKDEISSDYLVNQPTVLDCGAGDGRALSALTINDRYAIEKSNHLISLMDKRIFVIGTEFNQQTLIDKEVDVTFSNPPYSEYELWSSKIISESASSYIYLVIPERWKNSQAVNLAIESRKAEAKILGSFDFMNAERKARAKVDIVKITLCHSGYHSKKTKTDPFEQWAENNGFKVNPSKRRTHLDDFVSGEKTDSKKGLVLSGDIISILDNCYHADMGELVESYRKITELDAELLEELGVKQDGILEGLKLKIKGLKSKYWNELFNRFERITKRLTKSTREEMLKTLMRNTSIDFNVSNAHAVIIWVIKNANSYYDSQLIDTYETMVKKANIVNYKSNQRTFERDEWHYRSHPEDLTHYKLDYRVVITNTGGINTSGYNYDEVNGLSKRAAEFLDDLCTISGNLGFKPESKTEDFKWTSGKKNSFMHKDGVLFEAKAFKNGNLHIKFNSKFMVKLNVEAGRLKGWVKSAPEAAEEMNIKQEEAQSSFKTNKQLTANNFLAIGEDK